jgi:hypothetical protein
MTAVLSGRSSAGVVPEAGNVPEGHGAQRRGPSA